MSTETTWAESIGHMLTRLRLHIERGVDSETVRHEIIARFEALEKERAAAVAPRRREVSDEVRRFEAERARDALREQFADALAKIERLTEERDAALANIEREAAGQREEAQRAADLTDEVQRMREERDAAVAALAAARAENEQLTEQLRKAKEDYVYQDQHAQTFFDESQFMRDLILEAMRGGR